MRIPALVLCVFASWGDLRAAPPHPEENPESPLMLAVPGVSDPAEIDFGHLPRFSCEHAVISDVRDRGGSRVHQHAYLAHHAGRYWAMWSDGPGVPKQGVSPERHRNLVPGHDQPGTRVSYATSDDGIHWNKPDDLSGPPRVNGFGWIARGFWVRNGELLALASHFNAPGYSGEGLSLEAFRWDTASKSWAPLGTVLDDSLNNFPPKQLPNGDWMMTRRDHNRQVSVMIGGVEAFDQWRVLPLASYKGRGRPEEPYWYVLPDGENIVGLIRDNGGSKRLLRTFSTDNGDTWSPIVRTNFSDATSKFFVLRTSRGYYAMASNANPRRRDPLTLAISRDGLVFTHLFHLVGGRHVDYPHMIEHDGHLLVAFSGAKQTMEVLKVSLDDVDALLAPSPPDIDWSKEAKGNAAEDRTAIVFDGKTPDKLACDTTLRKMPDGSWVMVMLGGGDKEPHPRNGVFITRSHDEGKTWSPMEPIDFGFPDEGDTFSQVPSELMVYDGTCTLFFATHNGTFGGWKEWMATSDDFCRSWSRPRPAPGRLHDRTFIRNHIVTRDGRILLPFQHYLDLPRNNTRNGILMSDDGGKTWTEHGDIRLTKDDKYRGWAENNIVELADGTIAMIIRADGLGGVLYYAESPDGGHTWPEFATKTDIPNPGSKATLYPLGGDTVALLHNPNPKHRSPLALWISFDGLKTWPYRRIVVPESVDGPKGRLNYPDGFVSADKRWLHFAFDDNRHRAVYIGARLPNL